MSLNGFTFLTFCKSIERKSCKKNLEIQSLAFSDQFHICFEMKFSLSAKFVQEMTLK